MTLVIMWNLSNVASNDGASRRNFGVIVSNIGQYFTVGP